MARRRKQTHDPRQLSLFDIMANQIEEIREENIQDDMREAARSASSPGGEQRPENAIPVSERQSIRPNGFIPRRRTRLCDFQSAHEVSRANHPIKPRAFSV